MEVFRRRITAREREKGEKCDIEMMLDPKLPIEFDVRRNEVDAGANWVVECTPHPSKRLKTMFVHLSRSTNHRGAIVSIEVVQTLRRGQSGYALAYRHNNTTEPAAEKISIRFVITKGTCHVISLTGLHFAELEGACPERYVETLFVRDDKKKFWIGNWWKSLSERRKQAAELLNMDADAP